MRNVSEKEKMSKREMNIISIVAVACDMWTNME
jgi:hypothetical protein